MNKAVGRAMIEFKFHVTSRADHTKSTFQGEFTSEDAAIRAALRRDLVPFDGWWYSKEIKRWRYLESDLPGRDFEVYKALKAERIA